MLIATIEPEELDPNCHFIIDVREKEENDAESIPHSLLCPLSSFDPGRLPPIEGKTFVFHCRSGQRSAHAAEIWSAFWNKPCCNLRGGILRWKERKSH